ncbi:MAG: hypothetical protein IKT40_02050 [Bacilli bacterium]|nr:hypothetical protein [Bacilli bacterium]
MAQRNFNPRSPIPKKKLMENLEKGLTLQEIAIKYNRSRSFISECCAMYNINLDEIQGREEKKKKRKEKKKKQSFVDIMYEKIKREL